jgi:hypothetical protein
MRACKTIVHRPHQVRAWAFVTTIGLLALVVAQQAVAQNTNVPNVTGRVSTAAGEPLPGVEVRIDGTRSVTQTDDSGTYRFANAPTGVQILRFHRIGYLPGALAVNVPSVTDSITLVMVPSRAVLDTVKVNTRIYDVGGIVVDEKSRPIPGATIDVIGGTTTAATTADESGWFKFTPVKLGPLIIKARKRGFAEGTYSLDVEDSRGIVLRLQALPADLSESKATDFSGFGSTEQFVWKETQQRIARRDARSRIVSREQLAPFSGKSLGEAIRMLDEGNTVRSDLVATNDQVCVVEDGYLPVGSTTLDAFAADNVDFVELYPPGTESSASVQRYLRNAGCRQTGSRPARGPFYAVIWLR